MEEEDRSLTVAAPGSKVVSAYRFLDLLVVWPLFGSIACRHTPSTRKTQKRTAAEPANVTRRRRLTQICLRSWLKAVADSEEFAGEHELHRNAALRSIITSRMVFVIFCDAAAVAPGELHRFGGSLGFNHAFDRDSSELEDAGGLSAE